MDEIQQLLNGFHTDVETTTSLHGLERIEIKYLGRNGFVNDFMKKITTVPVEQKKEYGAEMNKAKQEITRVIADRRNLLLTNADTTETTDITLPGTPYPHGSLHLVTYAVEEISRIFNHIGFIRITYPEVEWEYYSFDSLNMPKDHPGRDDFETFFTNGTPDPRLGKMIMSPHTSSGQVREMQRVHGKPPIRMISIGKCYRPNWSTKHVPMFHQFESLCVDTDITIGNLKGTIDYFVKEFFGEKREVRLRPHHFQFTEPSFEVDITCDVCRGSGKINNMKCKVCKQGWLELAGAGMVHPNVLKEGGIDTDKYTGWAFAFGLERIMMMKEGLKLDDMRILYSGDLRFLKQF